MMVRKERVYIGVVSLPAGLLLSTLHPEVSGGHSLRPERTSIKKYN